MLEEDSYTFFVLLKLIDVSSFTVILNFTELWWLITGFVRNLYDGLMFYLCNLFRDIILDEFSRRGDQNPP